MSLLPSAIFKYLYIDARRTVLPDSLGHLHRAVHGIVVPHESADESNHNERCIRRIHSSAKILGNERGTRCLLPARQGTPTEKRKHQARNSSMSHKSFIHQVRQMIRALSRLRRGNRTRTFRSGDMVACQRTQLARLHSAQSDYQLLRLVAIYPPRQSLGARFGSAYALGAPTDAVQQRPQIELFLAGHPINRKLLCPHHGLPAAMSISLPARSPAFLPTNLARAAELPWAASHSPNLLPDPGRHSQCTE